MHVSEKSLPSKWLGSLVTSLIVGVALVGIVAMQSDRLRRGSLTPDDPKQVEQQEKVRLNVLKQVPTFGFDNVLASWTFLNFLQYFGDEPAREKTGYSLNSEYFDVITHLDPRFAQSYFFLSNSVSFYQGEPKLAVTLMERGTEALSPQVNPKSFIVWRYKGLDELLLLGDIPAAIHSYEMAAAWAQGTPDADLAPIFQQTAEFLKRDPDSVPARFQSWLEVYTQAAAINDRLTQERAKQALLALGATIHFNQQGEMYFVPPTFSKKSASPQSQAPAETQ